MSLIELVIAFAIVTICITVLYQLTTRTYRQAANTREDFQASRLRTFVASKALCPVARPAACSSPGTFFQVDDKGGSPLISVPSPPTVLMGFSVRAQCIDCSRCANGKKILIEYLRRKPGDAHGHYWKDLHDGIIDTLNGGAAMNPSIALKTLKLLRNPMSIENEKDKEDIKLTNRETEVLEHLSKGLNYVQIAENLILSTGTVRKHIENIYRKLQVHNKLEAVQKAKRNNLI